ncbi:MAG: putative Na+/H+ antiporter [Nitrospira sp.]|nr:putative Na+/H+ antiporter [Nitrospira sp.]
MEMNRTESNLMPSTIQPDRNPVVCSRDCTYPFYLLLPTPSPSASGSCRLWHLLGEVEVVFGFWAAVLMAAMFTTEGAAAALRYIDTYPFIEPMFVFAIP